MKLHKTDITMVVYGNSTLYCFLDLAIKKMHDNGSFIYLQSVLK